MVLGLVTAIATTSVWVDAAWSNPVAFAAHLDLAVQKANTIEVDMTVAELPQTGGQTKYYPQWQGRMHVVLHPNRNRLRAEASNPYAYRKYEADFSPAILVVNGSRTVEYNGYDKT